MEKDMMLPKYYSLVKLVAQIGAVFGCVTGTASIIGGLAAFKIGLIPGIAATFYGGFVIILSLAGLGITYCFLAIVEAQIDSRNAIIRYTKIKLEKFSGAAPNHLAAVDANLCTPVEDPSQLVNIEINQR